MKSKYLIAALATLSAAPATAQVVAGPRVEAMVGFDSVRFNLDELGDLSRDGVLFGIGAGYDFGAGPVAMGVDVEASDSTTDLSADDGTNSAQLSMGRDLYAGVRLTGAVSPSFNLYGKLGYTNARVKASATLDGDTEAAAGNLDGIRGGLGGQFMLAGASYVGAEYRYSNYEADVSRHQVAAVLGFRF